MKALSEARAWLASALLGRPYYAYFRIARRCRLSCRQCAVRRFGDEAEELDLAAMSELADGLKRAGLGRLVISGGEPFLRDDLAGAVAAFAGSGLSVRVQTSGYEVSDEMVEGVFRAGAEALTVSLDTLDPSLMERICGADVLPDATRCLKRAVAMAPFGLNVAAIVVSRLNAAELPAIVEYVNSIGAYAALTPYNPGFPGGNFAAFADEMMPEPGNPVLAAAIDEVIRMKRKGARLMNSRRFLQEIPKLMSRQGRAWRCDAGRLYIEILPDGRLGYCNEFTSHINLAGTSVSKALASQEFRAGAAATREACAGCTYPCYREVSNLFRDPMVMLGGVADMLRAGRSPRLS